MKTLVVISLLLIFSRAEVTAQSEESPCDPAPSNPEYPIKLKAPDLESFNMPNTDYLNAYGKDSETGKLHFYMHTESGLFFDFCEKKIRDFKNGEVYQFKKEVPDESQPRPHLKKKSRKKMLL